MLTFKQFINEEMQPLYVCRPLLNQVDLHTWAIGQGFDSTIKDMHVTLCFSRTPFKWPKPQIGNLTVYDTRDRKIEVLGDNKAIVMTFYSLELEQRWKEFQMAGALWQHASYKPHITISYGRHSSINTIKPYVGPLKFGSEIFKVLDPNWIQKVKNTEYS